MLHDVLLSLLGFPGDVIVESEYTFKVADGFDLVNLSEKELLNRIVPLGWYYLYLSSFVERYEVQWGDSHGDGSFQSYLAACAAGIADLLAEYVRDISLLEQKILTEGPVPLSYIATILQKYTLTMPVVHSVCSTILESRFKGGQILDYLYKFRSGIPLVALVI